METTRKHLRFNCNGSADLTDGANGRVWGPLGDLSLGGFYLSTFGPWPVDTEVCFKLVIDGKEICGTGKVATSHPGVGMAIAYKEVPPEYRSSLEEVVHGLEVSAPPEDEKSFGLKV
jgi:hypothetical protein